jgi:hypothetical protein
MPTYTPGGTALALLVSDLLRPTLFLAMTAAPLVAGTANEPQFLGCDREMRKTFEAIQAWRRSHNCAYPAYIADLEQAGLLPADAAICPDVLGERQGASPAHKGASSSADSADPPGTYQYEMSAKLQKSRNDKLYLPTGAAPYTLQDVKSVLLRRPFFEQVPILRCLSHRDMAPAQFAGGENDGWRNLTVEGNLYWSKFYWEQRWLDDVPFCAREANVLFGAQGPPFYTNLAPTSSCALDFRKWSCAFGDHAWWWTYPMFEEGANRQWAAHLRPFFEEKHGRVLNLNRMDWWINGLVQLQGRIIAREGVDAYRGPGMEAFAWQKTGVVVGRVFARAAWLQGTAWTAKPGETTGWLIWHYADGSVERAPITYGRNTARFWAELRQIEGEKDFVQPVWRYHEAKEAVGKERWLRIYEQEWVNPRPDTVVDSLDFVSNQECRAAPFLIAVNVLP